MGLQSFLSHAQDDPGTQEAIRRLLEKDDPQPPQRFISSPPITDSPPVRASVPPPVDEALAGAPTYQPPIPEQPALPPPTRMNLSAPVDVPTADYSAPPPTRVNPRQGVSTAGMSPMDAAQARVQVAQGASPQQRINTDDPNFTEIGAPHGISRLKAAGRLFLNQLKSGHGLLGGVEGAIEGAIAPGHAQDLKHQQEVAEAQGNFNEVAANQKTQAQIDDINAQVAERKRQSLLPPKLEPPHEDTRSVTEGEYSGVEAGTQIKRIWNGTKFVDEVDPKTGKPTIKALPPVRQAKNPDVQWVENADGSKTAWTPDPKSATGWSKSGLPDAAVPPVKPTPDSNQWQVTNKAIDENIAGFRARQAKIDEFLNATPATIQVPYSVKSPAGATTKYKTAPNPAYESQKKERNALDDKIAEENGKRKAPPPTRAATTSQYAGKPWSLGAWRAKNPNASAEQENAAKTKAANAQMKVIE